MEYERLALNCSKVEAKVTIFQKEEQNEIEVMKSKNVCNE